MYQKNHVRIYAHDLGIIAQNSAIMEIIACPNPILLNADNCTYNRNDRFGPSKIRLVSQLPLGLRGLKPLLKPIYSTLPNKISFFIGSSRDVDKCLSRT